jgi:hypothetical protein
VVKNNCKKYSDEFIEECAHTFSFFKERAGNEKVPFHIYLENIDEYDRRELQITMYGALSL